MHEMLSDDMDFQADLISENATAELNNKIYTNNFKHSLFAALNESIKE
jgi:hypothetical protein